jgi:hypothetical protein
MKKLLSLFVIASLVSGFAIASHAKDSDGKKHRTKKTEKSVKSEDKNSNE